MKNYKFNIIRVPLTIEEKRQRVLLYNEFEDEHVDVEEFIKQDIYDEFIDFKCLNCGFEERAEADIVLECFNPYREDYPTCYCVKCNKPKMVPIDIFHKLSK